MIRRHVSEVIGDEISLWVAVWVVGVQGSPCGEDAAVWLKCDRGRFIEAVTSQPVLNLVHSITEILCIEVPMS